MFRVELPLLVLIGWVTVSASASVVVDPPRDPEALRSNWRYVGMKANPDAPSCPEPSPAAGWSTAEMFPGTDNRLLSRFCVYEATSALPSPPDIPGLARLDRDAMAVQPMGGVLETALAPAVEAHFKSQVGDLELPLTGGQRVRLAVVDTAATRESGGENYPGTSPHGYTLLNIARRLTCAGANETACVSQVSSRLALSWECFDRKRLDTSCRNPTEGGLYGLIGEMAQAVHAEVRQWRAVGPSELVLNVSIGWDSTLGGLEPRADMPAPVAAVYAALEDAVCRGAWVVAAAGNREGGPTPEQGPILPAAWEARTAPTFAACNALGVGPQVADFPGPFAGAVYRPLVYAAGGVRADDGRVFNSRVASAPRLVAFADHALVTTLAGDPSADLAGTSAAALVVSAASAAARYYRPDLKPYELLDELYDGGRDLGRVADFCQGGSPCPDPALNVRRVTMCGTLAYVCRSGGPFCPPAALLACAAAAPFDLSAADLRVFQQGAAEIDLGTLTSQYVPIPECRAEKLEYVPGDVPVDPCPHWQYHTRSPARATEPQPGSYPCPNCTYDQGAGTVYVEIDDEYEGELTGATLKCGEKTWSLGGPEPWRAGDTAVIEGVGCASDETMLVSFTVDGADSATSTVLVEP